MAEDFLVLSEHPSLIDYVDGLQRKNVDALSFYPRRQVFEREQAKGANARAAERRAVRVHLCRGGRQGYKVPSGLHPIRRTETPLRGRAGAGAEHYAEEAKAASITLRCGFDLDANEFWKSLGYGVIAIQDGGIRRMRKINVWRKQLSPELFEPIHLEPAKGVQDASVWARNKQTGLVTQFVRGKAMHHYRRVILEADAT